MSNQPLLNSVDEDEDEDEQVAEAMPTKDDVKGVDGFEEVDGLQVIRPGSVSVPEDDPAAPSQNVSSMYTKPIFEVGKQLRKMYTFAAELKAQ